MKHENEYNALMKSVSGIAEQMKGIYDRAYIAYKPLVDDICSRHAEEKEVDWLLSWLLDFAGDRRVLGLYKQVCRAYRQIYPDIVAFYIMDYFNMYEPERLDEHSQ